jgi:hypothetical protein
MNVSTYPVGVQREEHPQPGAYFSAQREHLLWDTLGGGFRVSVTKTAQVELRNGRV